MARRGNTTGGLPSFEFATHNGTAIPSVKLTILDNGNLTVNATIYGGSISTANLYPARTHIGYWDIYRWGGGTITTLGDVITTGDLAFDHTEGTQNAGMMWLKASQDSADSLDFTGSHRSVTKNKELYSSNYIGYIVASTGNFKDLNSKYKNNKQNIKINSALPYVELTNKSYCPCVYGVISNNEDINNQGRAYEVGRFVTGYKQDKADHRIIINGLGEGAVYVSDYNGVILNGDYVSSSPIPGISMKQNDDIIHNYTVAKITMNCDFNPAYEPLLICEEVLIYTSNIKVTTSNIEVETSNNETSNYDINISNVVVTSNYQNVLDSNGDLIYIEQRDDNSNVIYDYEYEMKYITLEGLIIDKDVYNSNVDFRIAFLGCTYHCA
jgi:hypothetical protein